MTGSRGMLIKFGIFATIMVLLTASLFVAFGQVRSGSTNGYSAVFADGSRLKGGDSVRVAGVRVGTVRDVALQPDKSVLVDFDADDDIVLTTCSASTSGPRPWPVRRSPPNAPPAHWISICCSAACGR